MGSSPKMLHSLCEQYFKQYDANGDGYLDCTEVLR